MRPLLLPLLALSLLASAFASSSSAPPPAETTANCAGTSTGLIPLTDLGAGSYMGVQGGLYPGGINGRPAGHDAAGIAIANALGPVDTTGGADANGKVVIVSVGMSNCTQEFSAFVPKCAADPQKRAEVVAIDCAVGGQTASTIKNPAAWYWDTVATRLRGRGSSPAQVQVVWMKEANAGPTGDFATSSGILLRDFGSVVRTIKLKFPNAKLLYMTSRIYAGYASTALNPEPYAYESGFVVKSLIAAQIAGEDTLNHDASQGPVVAPWLSWGPYLWADGLNSRADGMTWACSDFATDGTHPATPARMRVADSLLAFFRADATTRPWYVVGNTGVETRGDPRGTLALLVRPNPARESVALSSVRPAAAPWRLEVVDAGGRRVRSVASGAAGVAVAARWNLRDERGRRVAPGVYWARLRAGETAARARIVVR